MIYRLRVGYKASVHSVEQLFVSCEVAAEIVPQVGDSIGLRYVSDRGTEICFLRVQQVTHYPHVKTEILAVGSNQYPGERVIEQITAPNNPYRVGHWIVN